MKFMPLFAAAALALAPVAASAGGLAPVVMEPVMIVDTPAPASSLSGYIVPAIFLALVAVAATAESDSDTATDSDN